MPETFQAREPGDPISLSCKANDGSLRQRSENSTGGNADMNADGKSDESIVPTNPANKDAAEASAESDRGKALSS